VTHRRNTALINLGLWGPPLLWATSLQLSEVLPYLDCAQGSHSLAWASLAALVFAVVAGVMVRRLTRREGGEYSFLAALSALSSAVFAFALALQVTATWILTGCER
jgi:hypothetical protein